MVGCGVKFRLMDSSGNGQVFPGRAAAEKRSFLEGYMTGYAEACKNLASGYAALHGRITGAMKGSGIGSGEEGHPAEGLTAEEMEDFEQRFASFPSESEEASVAEEDEWEKDPNVRNIMGK
jgi:hypothetical protein